MRCSALTSTGDRAGDGDGHYCGAHSKAACPGRKQQERNQDPCRWQATAWTKNDLGRWPLKRPPLGFAVNATLWMHMHTWGQDVKIVYANILPVQNRKRDRLHPRKRDDFSPLYRSSGLYWTYPKCEFSRPEGTERSHRTPLSLPLLRDLATPLLASWHWLTLLSCTHKYRCPIYSLCFHWVSWRCVARM